MKRVGDIGPDVIVYLTCAVIGLGGRGVIKTWTEVAARVRLYMLTSALTSLVPLQFSHWLKVRKVGTAHFLLRPDRFLYLNVLMVSHSWRHQFLRFFSKCYQYTCISRGFCQLLVQETLRSQLLISLPSTCARMETSVWVCSLWQKPMIRNSVFVTFRLSLLALNQELTLANQSLLLLTYISWALLVMWVLHGLLQYSHLLSATGRSQ